MDKIESTSNSGAAANDTPNSTPSRLPALKEKAPQDADTTKAEKEKEKSTSDLHIRQNILRRLWQWIRQDTTSTDWLIVVLTAVIAGTSYLQWHEIRTGSSDTHTLAEAAKKQADKMSEVSDAAKQIQQAANGMVAQEKALVDNSHASLESNAAQNRIALNNTIEEFRLEHRAWISPAEITLGRANPDGTVLPIRISQMLAGDRIFINVACKNTGASPAFNVSTSTNLDAFPITAPAFRPLVKGALYGILQPSEEVFQTLRFEKLTPDYVTAFSSGLVHIYGRIDYHDAFGIGHWTTFCRIMTTGGGQAECPEQPDATDGEPKPN